MKIARNGIDTEFTERPCTKAKEPKMDIKEKTKVMKQLKVQVESGFMAGPFLLDKKERLIIDSPKY